MGSARYRVLFELGEGGTATVHLALAGGPAGFNKLVVLKALRQSLAQDEDMRRLFVQEANISARFNHPNIVQVQEILEQDAQPMIVLEYLDGQTLEQVARPERGLPFGVHLHVITRVLRALDYAHAFLDFDGQRVEVVHRDVSPHNVMLTYEGHVKLLDFGIAKVLNDAGRTETGVIRGKLRYMAPEQVVGEPVDRRADLFAVGVMLWQAAAGEKLWKDLSEPQILDRIANGKIPDPVLGAGVPSGLDAVIRKALAPAAEDRYQTAAEMNADLTPLLAEVLKGDGDGALGRFLAESFRETRDKTRAVIDAKMREAPTRSDSSQAVDFGTGSVPRIPTAGSGTRSTQVGETPGTTRAIVVTAVAVALLSVGLLARNLWAAPPEPPPPMEHAPTPVDAGVAPVDAGRGEDANVDAARTLTLEITAFPETATVMLDGQPLEANPFSREFPSDGSEHLVHVEARGHDPHEETVVFDGDRNLVIRLTPRATTAHRRTDSGTTAPSVSSECNPPYFYDERGIKTYRPQCFR